MINLFKKKHKEQHRRYVRTKGGDIEVVLVDELGPHDPFWDSDRKRHHGWYEMTDTPYNELLSNTKCHVRYMSPSKPGF